MGSIVRSEQFGPGKSAEGGDTGGRSGGCDAVRFDYGGVSWVGRFERSGLLLEVDEEKYKKEKMGARSN